MQINWPNGYADYYKRVRHYQHSLTQGSVVALDPASGGSSMPGYAVFRGGEFVQGGTLELPRKLSIDRRLRALHAKVTRLVDDELPAVFLIELIRGQFAHVHLQWSVGVALAAGAAPTSIEVPIKVWRALAATQPDYVKGDAADARLIGESTILIAKEFRHDHSGLRSARVDLDAESDDGAA